MDYDVNYHENETSLEMLDRFYDFATQFHMSTGDMIIVIVIHIVLFSSALMLLILLIATKTFEWNIRVSIQNRQNDEN